MSDREKLTHALRMVVGSRPSREQRLELERLLRKNQNGPPDGEGDGSFSADTWVAARDALFHLDRLHEDLERLDECK